MSVAVTYEAVVTVVETLETNTPAALATKKKVTHDQYNTDLELNSSTTPPVTMVACFSKALSVGAGTIDLTALTGTNGGTINGTGLKLQILRLRAPIANANPIIFEPGAANPYNFMGASMLLELKPGDEVTLYAPETSPDVASGAKIFDLTGTGSQTLDVEIVLG